LIPPATGQVQSGLVDELLHPGLLRFSISSTSSLSDTGTASFIDVLLRYLQIIIVRRAGRDLLLAHRDARGRDVAASDANGSPDCGYRTSDKDVSVYRTSETTMRKDSRSGDSL
jgi:hypothetical protein